MGIWDENQNFEIIGIRFVIVFVLILSPLCHNLSQNFRLYNTRWRLSRDLSYKQINVCEIFQVKWNLETFCSSTFCWCTWAKKSFLWSALGDCWKCPLASWWHLTHCSVLQVSSSFLRNLLNVIKDTLEITESGGPTLLELLSKACSKC